MAFFNKLQNVKNAVTDKFDDVKYFVEDKTFDTKYFVKDKVSDVKDFVGEKGSDAKYFVKEKAGSVKDFVNDKTYDAKNFVQDKANIESKADIAEVAAYVLFPAQIPLKIIMRNVGKDSSTSINSKNRHLVHRIDVLESYQKEGNMLNDKLNKQLVQITNVKKSLLDQLVFFAEVLEKIHNRPVYNISLNGQKISFEELFKQSVVDADFAMIDSYLIKIYDEDAGIMDGLMRSPVFAAILKFREKTLKNKIENAVHEVNECINNMKIINGYLRKMTKTAGNFEKELSAIQSEFSGQVYQLADVVNAKSNFEEFTNEEITLLDTNIKFVHIIVALLNTHLFEKVEPDKNGLTPTNEAGVSKVIQDAMIMRNQI